MTLTEIANILVDGASATHRLQQALDAFALLCSEISEINPDPSYTAWSDDTFLSQGVAINPKAAAYCIKDYQRSVVFIRGVHAALRSLQKRQRSDGPIKVLYAGCGPFATLLLPLLTLFEPRTLDIHLLDIHQDSLDSVARLLRSLALEKHQITLLQADASEYQHSTLLDLIVVETMQKALEQEPQFAVTANLATQLDRCGIFLPQKITVELCLARLEEEKSYYQGWGVIDPSAMMDQGKRYIIKTLIELSPASVKALLALLNYNDQLEQPELPLGEIVIPSVRELTTFQALLFTRIAVFGEHKLDDYECSLTLPSRCFELEPLQGGACFSASYVLGSYPKIHWLTVSG